MNKYLCGLTLAGCMSAAIAPVADAAPAKIWTSWQETNLTQTQCMSRAERAIRDLGYNYEVLQSGVYGEDGDYSVTIRCTTEWNFIFFIATHPNTDWAADELNFLIDTF